MAGGRPIRSDGGKCLQFKSPMLRSPSKRASLRAGQSHNMWTKSPLGCLQCMQVPSVSGLNSAILLSEYRLRLVMAEIQRESSALRRFKESFKSSLSISVAPASTLRSTLTARNLARKAESSTKGPRCCQGVLRTEISTSLCWRISRSALRLAPISWMDSSKSPMGPRGTTAFLPNCLLALPWVGRGVFEARAEALVLVPKCPASLYFSQISRTRRSFGSCLQHILRSMVVLRTKVITRGSRSLPQLAAVKVRSMLLKLECGAIAFEMAVLKVRMASSQAGEDSMPYKPLAIPAMRMR